MEHDDLVARKLGRTTTPKTNQVKFKTATECPGFEFDPIYGFQGRCKVCKFSKAEHPGDPLAKLRWLKKQQRAEEKRQSALRASERRASKRRESAARTAAPAKTTEETQVTPPNPPEEERGGWISSALDGAKKLMGISPEDNKEEDDKNKNARKSRLGSLRGSLRSSLARKPSATAASKRLSAVQEVEETEEAGSGEKEAEEAEAEEEDEEEVKDDAEEEYEERVKSKPRSSRFSSIRKSIFRDSKRNSSKHMVEKPLNEISEEAEDENVESDPDPDTDSANEDHDDDEEDDMDAFKMDYVPPKAADYEGKLCHAEYPEDDCTIMFVKCPKERTSKEGKAWVREKMLKGIASSEWKQFRGSRTNLEAGRFYEGRVVEFEEAVEGEKPTCSVQFSTRADSSHDMLVLVSPISVDNIQLVDEFKKGPISTSLEELRVRASTSFQQGASKAELQKEVVLAAQELDVGGFESVRSKTPPGMLFELLGAAYPDEHGMATPLVLACEAFLAWAHVTESCGSDPEDKASLNQNLAAIKFLVSNGADVNRARKWSSGEMGQSPLAMACMPWEPLEGTDEQGDEQPSVMTEVEVKRRMALIKCLLSHGAETPRGQVVYVENKPLKDFICDYGRYKIAVVEAPPPKKVSSQYSDRSASAGSHKSYSSLHSDASNNSSRSSLTYASESSELERKSMASKGSSTSQSSTGSKGMRKLLCIAGKK